jgi:hypothetical protein
MEPVFSRIFRRRESQPVDERPVEDPDSTDLRDSIPWAAKLEQFVTTAATPEATPEASSAPQAAVAAAPTAPTASAASTASTASFAPPALAAPSVAETHTAEPASRPVIVDPPRPRAAKVSPVADALGALMAIEGAKCVALVDSNSGMVLGQAGDDPNLEIAAASNTQVVRATLATVASLRLTDAVDDLLFTLSTEFHIIRPLAKNPTLFFYLVLHKARANLALARYKVAEIDSQLVV